jgi:general secretion pathway protein G
LVVWGGGFQEVLRGVARGAIHDLRFLVATAGTIIGIAVTGKRLGPQVETTAMKAASLGVCFHLGIGENHMRKQKGFTLVELVVVVMILGILAAVAAPKLMSTSGAATDNALRHTLGVVRDAIDRYAAENGGVPPSDPANDLLPFLRGTFPKCPVAGGNANIKIVSTAPPLTPDTTNGESWMYTTQDGTFIVNSTANASDGATPYNTF